METLEKIINKLRGYKTDIRDIPEIRILLDGSFEVVYDDGFEIEYFVEGESLQELLEWLEENEPII